MSTHVLQVGVAVVVVDTAGVTVVGEGVATGGDVTVRHNSQPHTLISWILALHSHVGHVHGTCIMAFLIRSLLY